MDSENLEYRNQRGFLYYLCGYDVEACQDFLRDLHRLIGLDVVNGRKLRSRQRRETEAAGSRSDR